MAMQEDRSHTAKDVARVYEESYVNDVNCSEFGGILLAAEGDADEDYEKAEARLQEARETYRLLSEMLEEKTKDLKAFEIRQAAQLLMVPLERYENKKKPQESFESYVSRLGPIKNQWQITGVLGEGGSAYVCEAIDLFTGEVVAAKLGKDTSQIPTTGAEFSIYEELEKLSESVGATLDFPKVHHFGRYGIYEVLVMERLGPSLHDLHYSFCGRMPVSAVMKIGIEILRRIEVLHSINVLHCDVKPANILSGVRGDGAWHLTDFDLSCAVRDADTGSVIVERGYEFRGTLHFAPRKAHEGYSHCRLSDLESLGYVLLYLLKGTLPWMEEDKENSVDNNLCMLLKRAVALGESSFFSGVPQEMKRYFAVLERSISVDTPPYNELKSLLNDVIDNSFDDEVVSSSDSNSMN